MPSLARRWLVLTTTARIVGKMIMIRKALAVPRSKLQDDMKRLYLLRLRAGSGISKGLSLLPSLQQLFVIWIYETSGSQSKSSQIQAWVVTSKGLKLRGGAFPDSCENGSCIFVGMGLVPRDS